MAYGGLENLTGFAKNQPFRLNVELFLNLTDDFVSGAVLDEQIDDILLVALPLFKKHIQRFDENALR